MFALIHSIRVRLGRWWRNYKWVMICTLALLALVFGYIGFDQYYQTQNKPLSAASILYMSLQLFVLGPPDLKEIVPWELQLARFLAAFVAAATVIQALLEILADQMRLARLSRFQGHVVICGLGRNGRQLVEEFRRHHDRVVAIESEANNASISVCREMGAIVLVGNAADKDALRKARVDRAAHMIVVCGNDGMNVEVVIRSHQLVTESRRRGGQKVQCDVHIVDLKLCDLVKRHRAFPKAEPFAVNVFNIYEQTARLLFEKHPLDHDPIVEGGVRGAHLVVLGFGDMGKSVVLQAARIGHFANGRRLRLTIIDQKAEKEARIFLGRFPQLNQACDAQFIERDVEEPTMLQEIAAWVKDDGFIVSVVACFGDDSGNLSCALSLLPLLRDRKVPVLVRMTQGTGLAGLLAAERNEVDLLRNFHPFGMVSVTCTRDAILNESVDVLARAIHQNYLLEQKQLKGGKPDNHPSMQPWETLAENLKESNRRQADHIAIKLRAVGCTVSRPEPGRNAVTGFQPKEVELLARMEHERWNAEKYVDGWMHGPVRDDEKKIHDCLVDWGRLPEQIREYDRHAVRMIPDLMALIGKTIYRETGDVIPTDRSLAVSIQPEIRLRVGVTGHRSLADVEMITERVHQILEEELPKLSGLDKQIHFANQPRYPYTLLTSLAEGADRLVAKEILKLAGSRIETVLPLRKDAYKQDFHSPESLQEFTELLNQSSRSVCLLKTSPCVIFHPAQMAKSSEDKPMKQPGDTCWIIVMC